HSELNGSSTDGTWNTARPITVRSAPGEWATIDGAPGNPGSDTFVAHGSWAVFRDFEVVNSNTMRCCDDTSFFRADMMIGHGSHLKFINLVVHDGGPGFYTWPDAQTFDTEIYGCIVYNI